VGRSRSERTATTAQEALSSVRESVRLLIDGPQSNRPVAEDAAAGDETAPDATRSQPELDLICSQLAAGSTASASTRARQLLVSNATVRPSVHAVALSALALAAWDRGIAADAVDLALAGTSIEWDRDDGAWPVVAALSLGGIAVAVCDERFALEAVEKALAASRAAENSSMEQIARLFRAHLGLRTGAVSEAYRDAREAVEHLRRQEAHHFVSMARAYQVNVLVRIGQIREAERALSRCRQYRRQRTGPFHWAARAWAEVKVADAVYGPERAATRLAQYGRNPMLNRILLYEPSAAAFWIRCALRTDDWHTAVAVAKASERLSALSPHLLDVTAGALHARGILLRDVALLADAARTYSSAWDRASALEDASVVATSGPDRRKHLLSAVEGYGRMSARRDSARANKFLQDLTPGSSSQAREEKGWESLTPTEVRIAMLAASGLTNAQIGASVYLSRFTVDFHLRQIFKKLGISSRADLVSPALREDLFPQLRRPVSVAHGRNQRGRG
jgi:DNA-binding CsgD family transcriptional regulator